MTSIASRASWGARYSNGVGNRPMNNLTTYWHHTVTAMLSANATVAQERAAMRAIEQVGQSRFGRGISYNYLIFPSGRIYEGASVHRIAYHTGGSRNVTGIAICMVGNYEDHHLTRQQEDAVAWLLGRGKGRWQSTLTPHRTVSATACPGRHAVARKAAIEKRVGAKTPSKPTNKEDVMNKTQEQKLDKALADIDWLKNRVGGTGKVRNLTDYARRLEAQNAAQGAALTALAQSKGVNADVIQKAINDAVEGLELTFVPAADQ